MQRLTPTVKCYIENKLDSDYYKKVTTPRTTFLPFSLMQLRVTHLMARRAAQTLLFMELTWRPPDPSQNSLS